MMVFLELALIGCVLYLGIMASISDCRNSLIPNVLLLRVLPIVTVLDIVYYGVFVRDIIPEFLFNFVWVSIFAVVLYLYNLWAAGDSKLLVVLTLALPARFYPYAVIGPFPGFVLIVMIFSIAFLYVIAESIVLGIKNGDLFTIRGTSLDFKALVVSYFFMVGSMTLCNRILMKTLAPVLSRTGMLIVAIDILIVLSLQQLRDRLSSKRMIIVTVGIWCILILGRLYSGMQAIRIPVDFRSWIIVLMVMLFRLSAEKYNYQEISIDNLKPRMIPSAMTVWQFSRSRVKGLPTCATEDLRARLSEEHIESIRRWKDSKQGKETILIVRKIPFAIFIFLGFLAALLVGGYMTWRVY